MNTVRDFNINELLFNSQNQEQFLPALYMWGASMGQFFAIYML